MGKLLDKEAPVDENGAKYTKDNIPTPSINEVSYNEGDASKTGNKKAATITLPEYKNVGVYYYNIKETSGNTAGVSYRSKSIQLKVSVIRKDNELIRIPVFYVDSKEKTDEFTDNLYSAGKLTVTKTVTGNFGDTNKKFAFTVKLKSPYGKTVKSTIKYTVAGGEEKTLTPDQISKMNSTDGLSITEEIKNGESIVFTNLPYGVTYEVTEDTDGYTSTNNDGSGTINNAETSVGVTNDKTENVDTGLFTNNLPYFVLAGGAFILAVFTAIKKRRGYED